MADLELTMSAKESISEAANKAAKGIDNLDKKTDTAGKRAKKVKKDFEGLSESLDETESKAEGAASGVEEVGSKTGKVSPQVAALQKQIDQLAKKLTEADTAANNAGKNGVPHFGKQIKHTTGLISRFGGELGDSVGHLGKFGTAILGAFATGGGVALGITAVVSGVSLIVEKLGEAKRAAEEAAKKQVEGWEEVRKKVTENTDELIRQSKIRKLVSEGMGLQEAANELEINKLYKDRAPLLYKLEAAEKAVADAHDSLVKNPNANVYLRQWQTAVDKAAELNKQIDTVNSKLAALGDQQGFTKFSLEVPDLRPAPPLLTEEEKTKGLNLPPIISKPKEGGGKDYWAESKKSLEDWNTALLDSYAKEKQAIERQEAAALKAATTLRLSESAKTKIRSESVAKLTKLEADHNAAVETKKREAEAKIAGILAEGKPLEQLRLQESKALAELDEFFKKNPEMEAQKEAARTAVIEEFNTKREEIVQQGQDHIASILGQGKPLDELNSQEQKALRDLERFLSRHPELQDQAESARTAIIEDYSKRRQELASKEAKKISKETDIWGNKKLSQEEENQKAQYTQGTQWAGTLAQGFKDSFESGNAMGILKAGLAVISSLLSTFGGPGGTLAGGVLGIVGGLFEDGGPPTAVQFKRPPERRSGGPTFAGTGEFSNGRPFIGHENEFVFSAPAVAGMGGMDRVAAIHEDARLGRNPIPSPSRQTSDAGVTINVTSIDAGGTLNAMRRVLNPASVKVLNYRQGGLLLSKLRVAKVIP